VSNNEKIAAEGCAGSSNGRRQTQRVRDVHETSKRIRKEMLKEPNNDVVRRPDDDRAMHSQVDPERPS
jgi:hypothetical protein